MRPQTFERWCIVLKWTKKYKKCLKHKDEKNNPNCTFIPFHLQGHKNHKALQSPLAAAAAALNTIQEV